MRAWKEIITLENKLLNDYIFKLAKMLKEDCKDLGPGEIDWYEFRTNPYVIAVLKPNDDEIVFIDFFKDFDRYGKIELPLKSANVAIYDCKKDEIVKKGKLPEIIRKNLYESIVKNFGERVIIDELEDLLYYIIDNNY